MYLIHITYRHINYLINLKKNKFLLENVNDKHPFKTLNNNFRKKFELKPLKIKIFDFLNKYFF